MRRALCVGIDEYPNDSLDGCASDAHRVLDVLQAIRTVIRISIAVWWIAPIWLGTQYDHPPGVARTSSRVIQRSSRCRIVLLRWPRHCEQFRRLSVTQDAENSTRREMSEVLKLANESKAEEVVIILDSCFSGWMGNRRNREQQGGATRGYFDLDSESWRTGIGGGTVEAGYSPHWWWMRWKAAQQMSWVGSVRPPSMRMWKLRSAHGINVRSLRLTSPRCIELRCCKPPINREISAVNPDVVPGAC